MSNYPSYLTYFARSFSGVSNTAFRVPPRASGQLEARGQMSFCLPTNCLVSCKDVRLVFTASTIVQGTSKAARLPKISSFIERIEVTAGGIVVDAGGSQSECFDAGAGQRTCMYSRYVIIWYRLLTTTVYQQFFTITF